MHFTTSIAAAILGMASISSAHMDMIEPAPLRSRHNKHANGNVDYDMTSPLDASGSDFPCKGSLNLVGTEQGASVADYVPGQEYKMTIDGGAFHGGGSCQASLSFDKGKSWTVIHSYVGNCPSGTGKTSYPFAIPADTPSGEAIFAWSWFNKIGNREMYMNCAVVTIKGGSSKKKRGTAAAMSGRPDMFVANVGNGCSTIEGKDLMFPDLGPDVSMNSDNTAPPPEEKCAKSSNPGGSKPDTGNDGGDKPSEPSSVVEPSKPTTSASLPGGVFITVSSSSDPVATPTTAPAASSTSVPVDNVPSDTAAPEPEPTEEPITSSVGPSVPLPTGGAGNGTSYPAGTACDNNGVWNCVGGKQFQRCASGLWTVMQPVAAGTECAPGVMRDIVITKRHARAL